MKGPERAHLEPRAAHLQARSGSTLNVRQALSGFVVLTLLILETSGLRMFGSVLAVDFDSANRLYEQGKFQEAIAAYQSIVQGGRVSPALYFNLGNAFTRAGDMGQAIAAYREAERLAPRDPDLRVNLQFVRSQVQGPTLAPGRRERWLGTLTLNEWAVLASIALWSWLLVLTAGHIWPAAKQSLRLLRLFGGVGTAGLCLLLGAAYWATSSPAVIVIVRDAAARSGPLDEAQTVFTVHDGAELALLDRQNEWCQVDAGDRRIGWLKRDQVVFWPPDRRPAGLHRGS
jgi:tetratricopeptide (TPR) repeat protein